MSTTPRKRLDASWDETLAANGEATHSLGVIPAGKTWRILRFGGAATGAGSDASAKVTLELAGVVKRAMGLVGTSHQLEVDLDIKGDGNKELIIKIKNGPGSPKEVTVWITGYEF